MNQAPASKDALHPPFSVSEPLFNQSQGQIFLMQEGFWAYVPDSNAQLKKLGAHPGDILRYESQNSDNQAPESHLFAVAQKHSWGLKLQRLDTSEILSSTKGYLSPLKRRRGTEARLSDGLCIGTGSLDGDDTCFLQSPPGTRWDIYAIDQSGRLVTIHDIAPNKQPLSYPFARVATIRREVDLAIAVSADPFTPLPTRWLAVAQAQPQPIMPALRLISDPRCQLGNPPHWLPESQHLKRPFELATHHPLLIEGQAFKHGADALLSCHNQPNTMYTPSLYRPMIQCPSARYLGAPFYSQLPVVIPTIYSPEMTWIIFLISAYTATADFDMASFWLERLRIHWRTQNNHKSVDSLALQAMTTTVAAGRPDEALFVGWNTTQNDWNRNNNPPYYVGLTTVYGYLNNHQEWRSRLANFSDLARRLRDKDLFGWFLWNEFRLSLHNNKEVHPLIFDQAVAKLYEEDQELWSLTLQNMNFIHNSLFNQLPAHRHEALKNAHIEHNLAELWGAYNGDIMSKPCEHNGENCIPDVYGRNITDIISLYSAPNTVKNKRPAIIGKLERIPPIDWRIGFQQLTFYESPATFDGLPSKLNAIALNVSTLPLIYPEPSPDDLVDIATFVSDTIVPLAGTDQCTTVAQTLSTHATLANDRFPHHAPSAIALQWLLQKAPEALCQDIVIFDDVARKFRRESAQYSHLIAPFYSALVAFPSDRDQRLKHIEMAADFSIELTTTPLCQKMQLTLAAVHITRHNLEQAQYYLRQANSCRSRDNAYQESALALRAITYFEQTGKLPLNNPDSLIENIRKTTFRDHKAKDCLNFQPLHYDFWHLLHADISALGKSLAIERKQQHETLEVRTTSEQLDKAIRIYDSARMSAQAHRHHEASSKFSQAYQLFTDLSHYSALARIEYINQFLYNGELLQAQTPTNDDNRRLSGNVSTGEYITETAPQMSTTARALFDNATHDYLFQAVMHGIENNDLPDEILAFMLLVEPEHTLEEYGRQWSNLSDRANFCGLTHNDEPQR